MKTLFTTLIILGMTFTVSAQKKYDNIGSFGEYKSDWALVELDKKYGFINDKGVEIVKPIYDKIAPFGEYKSDWALVQLNNKLGFINNKAKEVVNPSFDKIGPFGEYKSNWAEVIVDGKKGFINTKGKFVFEEKSHKKAKRLALSYN
ncbi:MAG: WG repeat-containing protein [Bacteroidia bacterium]|nr:WG repeat-containing protein [Bacteroidia bacterium]